MIQRLHELREELIAFQTIQKKNDWVALLKSDEWKGSCGTWVIFSKVKISSTHDCIRKIQA